MTPSHHDARVALERVPPDQRRAVIEWCLQLADRAPGAGWETLAAYLEGWMDGGDDLRRRGVARSGGGDLEPDLVDECDDCAGTGDEYRAPTPADLLTDPRVQALVTALRRVQGDYSIEEEEWRCVDEALGPFEEVGRG